MNKLLLAIAVVCVGIASAGAQPEHNGGAQQQQSLIRCGKPVC